MTFSQALDLIKQGKKIKRKDWGGYWFIDGVYKPSDEDYEYDFLGKMIIAKLKDNAGYAPATPYQADLMAEDWEVVE